MPVMMIAELSDTSTAQYDQVNEKLGIQGPADEPAGLIQHVVGDTGEGLLIADVWESTEAFERFFADGAAQALADVGAPKVEPSIYPIHDMVRQGAGTEANVFLLMEIEEFSPEKYDSLVAKLRAHADGGAKHPAVSHYAADRGDGTMVVLEVWDSSESFEEWADSDLASAGFDVGTIDLRVERIHNRYAA